jgi:hypothetical protein
MTETQDVRDALARIEKLLERIVQLLEEQAAPKVTVGAPTPHIDPPAPKPY